MKENVLKSEKIYFVFLKREKSKLQIKGEKLILKKVKKVLRKKNLEIIFFEEIKKRRKKNSEKKKKVLG